MNKLAIGLLRGAITINKDTIVMACGVFDHFKSWCSISLFSQQVSSFLFVERKEFCPPCLVAISAIYWGQGEEALRESHFTCPFIEEVSIYFLWKQCCNFPSVLILLFQLVANVGQHFSLSSFIESKLKILVEYILYSILQEKLIHPQRDSVSSAPFPSIFPRVPSKSPSAEFVFKIARATDIGGAVTWHLQCHRLKQDLFSN